MSTHLPNKGLIFSANRWLCLCLGLLALMVMLVSPERSGIPEVSSVHEQFVLFVLDTDEVEKYRANTFTKGK